MTDILSAGTMRPLWMFLWFSEHIIKYNLQQRQLEKLPYQLTGSILASITELPSNTWIPSLVAPGTHWKLKEQKNVKTRTTLKQWLTFWLHRWIKGYFVGFLNPFADSISHAACLIFRWYTQQIELEIFQTIFFLPHYITTLKDICGYH